MYDPEPRGFNPLRLIIIMVIAVVIIMAVTVALNGNSSNNELWKIIQQHPQLR